MEQEAASRVGGEGGGFDGAEEREGGAEGFFVGGHDADAAGEEGGVGFGEGLVGGVVDEDAFAAAGVAAFEVGEDFGGGERGLAAGAEVVRPGGEG